MSKREQHNEQLMTKAFGSTRLMNSIKSISVTSGRGQYDKNERASASALDGMPNAPAAQILIRLT